MAFTSSGKSQPLPDEVWDISLADRLGTTPWDVRENATLWDVLRLRLWFNAKSAGDKVANQKMRNQQQSKNRSASRSTRRRR
tara:strand:- start:129 stop:374 length:246 start_codon:yes stop_codon:yes gene_type:complete